MLDLNIHNKCILLTGKIGELESLSLYNDRLRVIIVLEGSGSVELNDASHRYNKDSVFILKAGQEIHFDTVNRTQIFVIAPGISQKNNFREKPYVTTFSSMFGQIEMLASDRALVQGKTVERDIDRESANQILRLIIHEMQNRPDGYKEVIRNSIFTLVHILDRNIHYLKETAPVNLWHPKTDLILEYLKQQLQINSKFDIHTVASQFNLSVDCINESLIARTGFTFKKLILKYRTDLFKSRLLKMDIGSLNNLGDFRTPALT